VGGYEFRAPRRTPSRRRGSSASGRQDRHDLRHGDGTVTADSGGSGGGGGGDTRPLPLSEGLDKLAGMHRAQKSRLQRALWRIGNPLRMWPLRLGLPSPPYTRRNAIIVETIGRRSGKRRRVPVGFLEDNGKLIVVAEDGLAASWVQNALARDGRLRVFLHGRWRDARLKPRPGAPETYLGRMGKVHAAFVRIESSRPTLIEITPE
jgi:deazaflavin-dependent oxidoreductase (nitroreductase family)